MSDIAQVFMSYAHADIQRVRNLHGRLRQAGLKPWIDEDDILAGKDWLDEIKSAIRQSDFCLLCLSPNSIDRRGVLQREIQTALDVQADKLRHDVFLLPAWIQAGAPFPKEKMDELPDALKRIQWINLGDPSGWEKLLRSINFQLARIGKRGPGAAPAAPVVDAGSISAALEPTLTQLRAAIKAGDHSATEGLLPASEGLFDSTDGPLPSKVIRTILIELSRQQWFDLVGRLADAVIRSGTTSPLVRRNYAEALLRHGFPSAGLEMLEAARSDAVGDQTELRDANLRLGRA
jgi:hypothetical protein